MSSLSKEVTKKSLTYSIVAIVVAFSFAIVGLVYPFPNNIGIILLTFSVVLMIIGVVSLILYFVNPEISYGMWISLKKRKSIDNKNVTVGSIIIMVIVIIGICVNLFVFYSFVRPF
ncbi:MAG: hypothetical protein ACW96X_10140 [Promethearchaeota archaeon]|jgi:hypothetical protein